MALIQIQIPDYVSSFRMPRQLTCLRTGSMLQLTVHLQKARLILLRSITKGTDLTVLPCWRNVPRITPHVRSLISEDIFHVQTESWERPARLILFLNVN